MSAEAAGLFEAARVGAGKGMQSSEGIMTSLLLPNPPW